MSKKKAFIQSGILILTATAIFMVNFPATVAIAPWVGLCAQPFWFYESFNNKQWGIFVCTAVVTGSWIMGLCQ